MSGSYHVANETPNITLQDHIPATDHATRYQSRLTDPNHGILTHDDLDLLSHVNCTYLSSGGGHPPTLLALKQHAQSLAVLISKLSTARTFVLVGSRDGEDGARGISDKDTQPKYTTMPYDAFDWLHDMSKPYTTTDGLHHVPLWALSNNITDESEEHGLTYQCPLHSVQMQKTALDKPGEEPARRFPYQTHGTLLQHANQCLEILDSEYSDTGGILSILPVAEKRQQPPQQAAPDDEHAQYMQGARNTIIGQWIMHHQHLVARMHELEINYGNALDMREKKAIIPLELLSDAGTYIRAEGKPVAYPQDRFMLAGIDEQMDDTIHKILDEEESREAINDAIHREAGVIGDRMWRGENENGYERGLTKVDLLSRFYRIRGARRSPIIIMPAAETNPRTGGTREAESRPTVVAIRQGELPPWSKGQSETTEVPRAEMERLRKDRSELVQRNRRLRVAIDVLKRDLAVQKRKHEAEQEDQAVLDNERARAGKE